eukprot:Awhi_evm1s6252
MYSSDRFQKEWLDEDGVHRCIMLLRDYGVFCFSDFDNHGTGEILLSVTYPSTLNNVSTISNLVFTTNYTSTNALTYSSRVITFITSTTTTTTTLFYNNF